MGNEIIEKLVETIIDIEFNNVAEKDIKHQGEYDDLLNKNIEIVSKLKKELSKDACKNFLNYDDNWCKVLEQMSHYWFKEGIKVGARDLKHFNDIDGLNIVLNNM